MGDPRKKALATLVAFHDLLGFGDLISSSGGTLDSAVGDIAYSRIEALRATADECRDLFPASTTVLHFNDTVTAILDVDVEVGSAHTDPGGIASTPMTRAACLDIIKFVGASAALHHACIVREEDGRLGPAARTFVVLGERWALAPSKDRIDEIPMLQANLAFAEAYAADSIGSSGGLMKRSYDNLFVNDYVWHCLNTVQLSLDENALAALAPIGMRDQPFPSSLLGPDAPAVEVRIFHRRRRFYSLMSHHAKDLAYLPF